MWDWPVFIWNWLGELYTRVWVFLEYMWRVLAQFGRWAYGVFQAIATWLMRSFHWFIRQIQALGHLNFRSIWNAIKKGFDRLRRALDWYNRIILEPFDKLRRQILDVYRKYFRPLILTLDQFRSIIRVVAIFDRRLAAALDRRLFQLERAIMFPITEALRRINQHSSYFRALLTASGYLDRILVLETLRRDALLVWEVLTNPLGRIYAPPDPVPRPGWTEMQRDWHQWLRDESGPIADAVELRRQRFRDTLIELE